MKADNGDHSYVPSFHAQEKEAMSSNSKARSMGTSVETVDIIRNLFVYGSLMDRGEAVKDLCPDTWENAMPALLRGYRRIYNKWSIDRRGCLLNIQLSQRHSVIGLILRSLSNKETDNIRRREGGVNTMTRFALRLKLCRHQSRQD